MYLPADTNLFNACRTLFGQDVDLSREFLDRLQPSGARRAFRDQAKTHHPDGYADSSAQVRKQQTERVREIRQAYELIISFLERRQPPPARAPAPAPAYRVRRPADQRPWQKPQPRPPAIPAIPLEFGMYSYYQGKVTYQQLIEALIWQRRQRPALGAIARQWGWLTEARVAQILGHRGYALRFGKKAVAMGYLSPHQVDALLKHQQSLQQRIGSYFIEQGWLSEEDAERISQSLASHNSQLARRPANRPGRHL
jgi:curved DNA-binding protein CbpA